jgi:hypothetical protein
LNLWFRNNFNSLGTKTCIFFETQKTHGLRVVNEASADPGIPGISPIPIDADHLQIIHPNSYRDIVVGQTLKLIDHAIPSQTFKFDPDRQFEQIGPGLSIKQPMAGRFTRRRLLITTAATVIVGALGGGAYWFLNRNGKDGKEEPRFVEMQPIDAIATIAAESKILREGFYWRERGMAPAGYIKGMALVYARVYCKLKAREAAALDMASRNIGDADHDALAYYDDIFARANMSNSVSGADTLRHLFVLLIGLGMRQSGGKYCEGWDKSAGSVNPDNASAGLFQTAFSSRISSPLLMILFRDYLKNPSGFVEVFEEGVQCSPADFNNFGSGDSEKFQRLSKECPAFAVEFAAVALRHIRKHFGPINRREAGVVPECDELLSQIQKFVDASPNSTKTFLVQG